MLPDSLSWLRFTLSCLSSDSINRLAQLLPNLKLEKNGLLLQLVWGLCSYCAIFLSVSIS